MVEEESERITAGDEHIDPHVTLVAIHQEGLVYVLLHNGVVMLRDLLSIPVQHYAETNHMFT